MPVRPREVGPLAGGQATDDRMALTIARGVLRHFMELHWAGITEVTLPSGRRADVMAVDQGGLIGIVEIKSSLADFRADKKWPDYRAYSDLFWFAVPVGFDQSLIPEECGLLVADAYGAQLIREAPEHRLAAARRKALLIRWGRVAAFRLLQRDDRFADAGFGFGDAMPEFVPGPE